MVRCSVLGCKSDSERKLTGISFHSFPENETIRMRWIDATGRINFKPKTFSKICSKHFDPNLLLRKNVMTVLFTNAVPFVDQHPQVQEHKAINTNVAESSSNIKTSQLSQAKEPETTMTAAPVYVLKNIDCNVMASTSRARETEVTMTAAAANTNLMASTSKGTSQDYRFRAIQSKLNRTIKQSADRLKKIRALRERSRRLTKKVANLEKVLLTDGSAAVNSTNFAGTGGIYNLFINK
ncbi:unnamed protein product [Parnassius apollo]|uniref:(apollo) hypothetical protein n=1 Tax=Parnassius apollo TaxID=110799 RepID=A0A8S3WDU1_PARAO|nr:unnamed protein product [Parnassius apollo]